MKLVFDIEADHLLADVTKVWCIVARDVDTDEVYTFDPNNIQEGLFLAWTQRSELAAMGERGQRYVMENLTWEKVAHRSLSIYAKVFCDK